MTEAPQRERLRALHAEVDKRLGVVGKLKGRSDEEIAIAAVPLLRMTLFQAEAIVRLAEPPNPFAAGANLRAQFEAWVNLRYLLLHGDALLNARKCRINAHAEVVDAVKQWADPTPEMAANLDQEQATYRTKYPEAFAEVEKQRRGKLHWSGLKRTKLVEEVGEGLPIGGKGLRGTYKYQSWAPHHDVLVVQFPMVRDAETTRIEGPGPKRLLEAMEHTCSEAHAMLADCWQVFAQRFYPPDL